MFSGILVPSALVGPDSHLEATTLRNTVWKTPAVCYSLGPCGERTDLFLGSET